MGATDFITTTLGKNEQDAFKVAKTEACYRHGHEGYTGTIAEKTGFRVFECPKFVSVDQMLRWANGDKAPAKHADLARRMNDLFEDKWNDAICIVPGKTEQWRMRKDAGIKSRQKFYVFTGLASC